MKTCSSALLRVFPHSPRGSCESRMQEPGMEPGTVWKGSSQEIFLLCASIQIQAACLLHFQIPIAHCLPPSPQDTCCTSKNTSDTLSQCLHLQLASCTSSRFYNVARSKNPARKNCFTVLSIYLKLPAQSYNDLILTPGVCGGAGGKKYLEVQEASSKERTGGKQWISGGAEGKQWVSGGAQSSEWVSEGTGARLLAQDSEKNLLSRPFLVPFLEYPSSCTVFPCGMGCPIVPHILVNPGYATDLNCGTIMRSTCTPHIYVQW